MPLLQASDPLPGRPRRVLIAGTSGSGKTTFGRRLAQELHIPHVEMDSLFHGPDWTPRQSFEAEVRTFSEADKWVTEWQYRVVRDLLADRADLLVWLDLSRATVMYQIIRRTLRRRLHREVLWNGNIEPPLRTFFTDRQHIVRWAWDTHPTTALKVAALRERRPELTVVRLTGRSAAERWLSGPLRLARSPVE